jgi:hypothetical protein
MGFEEREIIMNFMSEYPEHDYTLRYFRPGVLLMIFPKVY